MLSILGSQKRLCSGLTRRDMLRAGGFGLGGLTLADLLKLQAEESQENIFGLPNFGKAKNCLLLFLYGSPSQLETFDMKPDAPLEIRGTMKPIASSLPGVDVCEHLPNTAKIMDRISVIRSVTHEYPIHGVAYATTGVPAIDVGMELAPYDTKHHPYIGSVVEFIQRQRYGSPTDGIPQNLALPFSFSSKREGEVPRAGPYAAYLGTSYNPIWTEFEGKSSRSVYKTLRDMKLEIHDPYVACTPESFFRLSDTSPQPQMTLDRLDRRRSLLGQLEVQRRDLLTSDAGEGLSRHQQMAFSLLTSTAVSRALDVRLEDPAVRDLYGMSLFGQGCLAGRRMLDVGTRLVSVFWDEYGLAGDAWDTHWNHYPRMLDQLMPSFDKALSGLITDLDNRGQLDETLVVVLSEHGRTPKLNSAEGGGRDHWSRVYSLVLAGAGVKKGHIVGASDKTAAEPADRPVSPKDVLATIYHLLGINPHTTILDAAGQRVPLVPETASVIPELLA